MTVKFVLFSSKNLVNFPMESKNFKIFFVTIPYSEVFSLAKRVKSNEKNTLGEAKNSLFVMLSHPFQGKHPRRCGEDCLRNC